MGQLLGLTISEAQHIIKADFPGANIQVLAVNSMITEDYRVDRVRIFEGGDGRVAGVPQTG